MTKPDSFTRRAIIDLGPYTLDVSYDPTADLDATFKAYDHDTSEIIAINGWLISSYELTE